MSQQGDLILIGVYLGLSARDCGVIWPYTICIPLPFEGYSIGWLTPRRLAAGAAGNTSHFYKNDFVRSTVTPAAPIILIYRGGSI